MIDEGPKEGGRWELPGGGLDFGEDIHEALKREVEEEVGLKVINISEKPVYVWTWRFEKTRNMEWFYSVVIAYQIEVADFNIDSTKEFKGIGLFSKEDLEKADLRYQTNGLKQVFDPRDFI